MHFCLLGRGPDNAVSTSLSLFFLPVSLHIDLTAIQFLAHSSSPYNDV